MPLRDHAFWLALGVSVFILGQPAVSLSQQVVEQNAFVDAVGSLDQVDQRTPLRTAQGFMRFAELGEYERAAEYLDMRYLPDNLSEADGAALAEQLYIVISRKVSIDFDALSDENDGIDGDGLPSYRDTLGTLDTQQGKLSIYLQLIPGKDDARIWKVSNASVALIPELYDYFSYPGWVEKIRESFPDEMVALAWHPLHVKDLFFTITNQMAQLIAIIR